MASPPHWTCVWASSRRWWRIGKPDMLQSIGSQRVGYNWTIEQQKIDNSKDYLLPPSFHLYKKSVSLIDTRGSLVTQRVNNMTAMWETCVQPLVSQGDNPCEISLIDTDFCVYISPKFIIHPWRSKRSPEGNGYPLQFSCLENPWKEEPRGLQSLVSHTVRRDTSEGHNVQHRELTQPCSIILWQKKKIEKRTGTLHVYVITESGACTLTTSTKLQNKYRSTLYQQEIREKRRLLPILSPPISLT